MTRHIHEIRDGEPRTILDSWPFLVCGLIVVCALVWGVTQGYV